MFSAVPPGADTVARRRVRGRRMRVARGRASENAAGGGSATRIARQSPRRLERDADVARAPDPEPALAETPKRNGRERFARGVCVADGRAEEAGVRLVFCAWLGTRRVALDAGARDGARARGACRGLRRRRGRVERDRAVQGEGRGRQALRDDGAAGHLRRARAPPPPRRWQRRGRGRRARQLVARRAQSAVQRLRRGACGGARVRARSCTRSPPVPAQLAVIAVEDATAHPRRRCWSGSWRRRARGTCSAPPRARRARRHRTRRV